MYIDNDEFGGWMQKLYAKLEELCKDVRVLRNADRVQRLSPTEISLADMFKANHC